MAPFVGTCALVPAAPGHGAFWARSPATVRSTGVSFFIEE
jgi:hypothetical protein